ncbi:MAG: hypothetical protein ABS37_00430 [Acidovorax sp. SCN 65-108]|nr:MAG: hypothetical protein ABS37_00430 [Acidovorax sp. SCN 65-108]OJV73534.1 MAG: hypothetical protein BGO35_13170 [Burkholderiales bacterium 64-34]
MNALDIAIKNAGGVGKLAAAIGVGQPVVSNWRARGTTPDAVHCVAIERATSGVVTRQALRPEDWHLIWPELLAGAGAEAVTQEPAHG